VPVNRNDLLLPGLDLEFLGRLPGVVGGTAVGDEDDAALFPVMLGQAVGDHLDHVRDGALVVVAGHPDQNVGGVDLLDAFGRVPSQRGVIIHERYLFFGCFIADVAQGSLF
jgi:hypothetical protein